MIISEIVTIILLVLKVTGKVDLSWWEVFATEIFIALNVYALFMVAFVRKGIKKMRGKQ